MIVTHQLQEIKNYMFNECSHSSLTRMSCRQTHSNNNKMMSTELPLIYVTTIYQLQWSCSFIGLVTNERCNEKKNA